MAIAPEVYERINQLLAQFKESARPLMQVTNEQVAEYEKGTYGLLWIKPSKRLCAALSVTREVLVMASDFTDQQIRIIAAAQHFIANSTGRLEPQVIIIIHQDGRGNQKLKDWGRERGLTIVPIYVGSTALPAGLEFERILAWEMFTHDPFDVTGPVADEAQFYGRRTETLELARQLQLGQVRSCLGIRKVGKTSVLNRVINNARDHHDCYCVMVDCSLDVIWSLGAAG